MSAALVPMDPLAPPPPPPPPPIMIPEALVEVLRLIEIIMRKNNTMIDLYIYPSSTPSDIKAYKRPLEVFHSRIINLSTLNLTRLGHLIDDPEILLADSLIPTIEQLDQSTHGFVSIFIDHYDPDLEKKQPYRQIQKELVYRREQLFSLKDERKKNQPPSASRLAPSPSTTELTFCRSAVTFVNNRDEGKLCHVMHDDLSAEDRDKLKNEGGTFVWWQCSTCAFKTRYHITSSGRSTIATYDNVKSYVEAPGVEFQEAWLVKCHLHLSAAQDSRRPTMSSEKDNDKKRRESESRKRESFTRDRRPSFFFNVPPRRSTGNVTQEKSTKQKDDSSKSNDKKEVCRYGCPFCYAFGDDLIAGRSAFKSAKDFARHLASRHKKAPYLPPAIMFDKYNVAFNGLSLVTQKPVGWDLNLK